MHWFFHQLPNLYFRTTTRASHPISLPRSWIWKEPFWGHCPSLAFRTRYTTMKRQADTTDMSFEEAEYFPDTAWDRAWDWLLSWEWRANYSRGCLIYALKPRYQRKYHQPSRYQSLKLFIAAAYSRKCLSFKLFIAVVYYLAVLFIESTVVWWLPYNDQQKRQSCNM